MNSIHLSYINNFPRAKEAFFDLEDMNSICIPKIHFNDIARNHLKQKSGIYFLVSSLNIYTEDFSIYVGKSSDLYSRVNGPHKNSKRNRINWKYALVFFKNDRQLSADIISYLERKTYVELQKNGFTSNLINGIPNGTNLLSKITIDDINDKILNQIKVLSDALGFPLFYINRIYNNNKDYSNSNPLYRLDKRGAKGLGRYTGKNKEFQVIKDYTKISNKAPNRTYKERTDDNNSIIDNLMQMGIINKELIFIKDYTFNSISRATNILEQSNVNGKREWRLKNK